MLASYRAGILFHDLYASADSILFLYELRFAILGSLIVSNYKLLPHMKAILFLDEVSCDYQRI